MMARRRACWSHAVSSDLGNPRATWNTERLIITPETATTDAVTKSDTALRLQAQAAFEAG